MIRAAWELAQTVTHGDIDRVEAFAAAQATVLVVRTLQALAVESPATVAAPPPPSNQSPAAPPSAPWPVGGA